VDAGRILSTQVAREHLNTQKKHEQAQGTREGSLLRTENSQMDWGLLGISELGGERVNQKRKIHDPLYRKGERDIEMRPNFWVSCQAEVAQGTRKTPQPLIKQQGLGVRWLSYDHHSAEGQIHNRVKRL